ncbi:MAG: glycosyltransferase family 4 protein [Pseudomonadota bacterium]
MIFLIIAGAPVSLINFRGHLIVDLIKHGLTVHAAAPGLSPGSEIHDKLTELGARGHDIHLDRTGMNPLGDVRSLIELVRLVRRIKPDYVLGYTIKPVIFGTLAAAMGRCPRRYALITGLGYSFLDAKESRRHRLVSAIVTRLYRRSLHHAQLVFFQNVDDQMLFRRLGLLNGTTPSVVVNGSGVDLVHYAPRHQPPARVTFLLIARLLVDKGIREYAEAAYRLKACYPDAEFQLVGALDSNPRSITLEELAQWEKDGAITYLGKLADVRQVLATASVFVLPTYYREGVPRTILEALSMGLPVITTDTPGCRETVAEGENGFLVPPRDVERLAEAMQRFLATPELSASMGARARDVAVEKYDVHKVNAFMLKEMGIS